MFPIRDHNPSNRTPWVTWAIIALNVVIYVMTADWGGNMRGFWLHGALYPEAVTHGVWLHGLVSYMFLHAGIMHIGGNMLFLWVFGDNLEDQLGHFGFALFYLLGGLAAAGAQIALEPHSPVPMVGASGAVAAVMGGYLLLFPRARVDILVILFIIYKIFTLRAFWVLGIWFAFQLFNSLGAGSDGVAYMAHLGGFVAGLAMMVPHFLRLGGPAFWRDTQGQPPHPSIDYQATAVPIVPRRRR
ncbi:rhomboid family intramembrane serine protease [Rhodobacter sp. TJ_12]|uniref:rhomboid family intramembrane serine protease n=1 Tax=Rhodobacter sp. TJ_12 TaxID=2029399 RepID=UPI001CBF28EB|nr:rhomboid family intramembrane serine protease [Rhodobacter sp. TJ_12]MBZ4024139.1 rhomboid family intramembrane serine protease [Rhodobacter sp. TJ_12]